MNPRLTGTMSSMEALLTELADATYRVARRHGFRGAFIDVELDLWQARPAPGDRAPGEPLAPALELVCRPRVHQVD